jgi:ribosome maturation factor RimP
MSTAQEQIEKFITDFLAQSDDLFLVELKITPGNQITVLLDGDKGITIEKCTTINRALYKYIEQSGLFADGNFSLEVSSPGVGKPLKLFRQYKKNVGRNLEVELADGTKSEGKLTEADEEGITIEEKEGKGKKMTVKITRILFNQIKEATVLITF